jgi:hypothetical protein
MAWRIVELDPCIHSMPQFHQEMFHTFVQAGSQAKASGTSERPYNQRSAIMALAPSCIRNAEWPEAP